MTRFTNKRETQSAIQTYEMTAESGVRGDGACADPAGALVAAQPPPQQPLPQPIHLQPLNHHKRKNNTHFNCGDDYSISECDVSVVSLRVPATPAMSVCSTSIRKRKSSSYGTGSVYNDDIGDDSGSTRTLPDKKQNHSEIEKRRRDKMNTYISELSSMVPMCGTMARKLDKLTVLRMAVQHLRSVRGALSSCPLTARPRPAFLSEKELNTLILQAGHDCFLLVVGCDRGRLMYVSASVNKVLLYDQSELIGQSLFDILHPKDVAKVKEQLSSSDLSPRERFIDAKTMLPLKADVVAGASRFSPGARRSFFCRIKCKVPTEEIPASVMSIKEDPEPTSKLRKKHSSEKKYCVVQCTGYLKSWAPAELSEASTTAADCTEDGEASNMSCLVAVGRTLEDLAPMSSTTCPTVPTRPLMYTSRHATDGKFIFVDQRVTLALGFLPQELLGTSLYEYVSGPEIAAVAGTHKAALLHRNALQTPAYSFRRKDGTFATIQTQFKPFRNPWTKDVECLVANNTVLSDSHMPIHQNAAQSTFEIYKQKPDIEMQRLMDSRVESHQIGSTIAEEVLRRSSMEYTSDLPSDLLQDAVFNQQTALVDNILGLEVPGYMHVRNNVPLSVAGVRDSPPQTENAIELPVGSPPSVSPTLPSLGLDGNGEAAMAVIMSLLEADAGLGGQVNFSGLPWPLP